MLKRRHYGGVGQKPIGLREFFFDDNLLPPAIDILNLPILLAILLKKQVIMYTDIEEASLPSTSFTSSSRMKAVLGIVFVLVGIVYLSYNVSNVNNNVASATNLMAQIEQESFYIVVPQQTELAPKLVFANYAELQTVKPNLNLQVVTRGTPEAEDSPKVVVKGNDFVHPDELKMGCARLWGSDPRPNAPKEVINIKHDDICGPYLSSRYYNVTKMKDVDNRYNRGVSFIETSSTTWIVLYASRSWGTAGLTEKEISPEGKTTYCKERYCSDVYSHIMLPLTEGLLGLIPFPFTEEGKPTETNWNDKVVGLALAPHG